MSGILVRDASGSTVALEKGFSTDRPNPEPSPASHPSRDISLSRDARVVALLDLLEVHIDSFAVCSIEDHCGLVVPPFDRLIVHYVLEGEGTIVSDGESLPIKAGMVIVVPKGLAKQINGRGPVHTLGDADTSCPLASGIIKFSVSHSSGGALILGCASVDASLGHRLALFEHLAQPLVFADQNQIATSTFKAILEELAEPDIGTKALVDTLMKQVLLLLLRDNLKRSETMSSIEPTAAESRVAQAITKILARPQDPHTVENLAHVVGMSRSCFARNFAETSGMSPMRYVQVARLTLASKLLKNSAVPVKAVAGAVGYASRSQFSRAFVLMFGTDPTTFRHRTNSATSVAQDPDLLGPGSEAISPTLGAEPRG